MRLIESDFHSPYDQRNLKWHRRFLEVAKVVASWSKDDSTKCGCVIVNKDHDIVATGYNGLARGLDDTIEERRVRPLKYLYAEHSERNAIYAAAKRGESVKGCIAYISTIPGGLPPCSDCVRAMIQAGIETVVTEYCDFENERWKDNCLVGASMLREAGVSHWEIPNG